ncbi:hypothetical protein TNCV_2369511 [Trichonephila clavipes]|nr:hypothetical protein TNCV_2369511 [Trichonephila clavipes]
MAKLEVDLGTLNRAFQTQTGVSGTIPKTEPAGGTLNRAFQTQTGVSEPFLKQSQQVVSLSVVERGRERGCPARRVQRERTRRHSNIYSREKEAAFTQTGVSGTIPKTEPAGGFSVRSRARQGERLPYKTSAEGEDEETFEHLQSREGSVEETER